MGERLTLCSPYDFFATKKATPRKPLILLGLRGVILNFNYLPKSFFAFSLLCFSHSNCFSFLHLLQYKGLFFALETILFPHIVQYPWGLPLQFMYSITILSILVSSIFSVSPSPMLVSP